ncbi:MAG: alpha/beta hydrolase [Clostridiales bacterium]|nr:alpha/beta hydrolase [Clostridiales bacterium]
MQATIKGCLIRYEMRRHPKADAPAVLLLHGWGCDSASFFFIENALLERFTVLTLDFPGHGQSGEPPEPWGMDDFAEAVLQVMDAAGIRRVKIVAHSFGGRVAVKLAAQHPERTEQLVITGGAGIRKPVTEQARKRAARFKRYNALLDRLRSVAILKPAATRLQARLRNRYGSPDYVKLDEVMRATFVRVISEDLFPLLRQIQAPTLLIWGDADTETPLWMGQTMEKEIPDAGLVIFEGGTHFAFLEQWRRFTVIVKQFFGEESA